ncbi:citrate/2-methylcitrate synthase [Gordonia sp. Z-3]|jgi:citrate synthase|uniref:citrate/2-methylcitrate synthase n=1 Tax=unclassified Gordonia (in: high G+C Gram-positive bacteria) TaxID=2657482 RepID=UPI000C4A36CE|nr:MULTISPECIES: citrate/2-methylcitrate synthase [unclassified Gordonia (in: high G+C Gram-positive bacteria)]MAU80468.1 citrate synthase/methylcitrate synthase [Gordonia sp. (in: high G+C Gram-positive bacteria)]MED5803529.1 citrate/2-methylcitrate synthase [Gordonia sp. Z-3]
MNQLIAPEGLANVVVADTEIGDVRGDEGFYHYREHSAIDLARTRSFEEVWYLFVHGALPDAHQLTQFRTTTAQLRPLPDELAGLLRASALLGDGRDTLAGLRTVLSAAGPALGVAPLWESDADSIRHDSMRAAAMTPTILAALHRIRSGEDPVEPDPELPVAANWLYQLTGRRAPDEHVRAVEQYLIATIDHGFNASTFTARVIASTGADVHAAVCGALGAFSGPLHGGAPDRALDSLDEIARHGDATAWAREQIADRRRIMGFGHAVYRTVDPRSELLREIALGLGGPTVERAVEVERQVVDVLREAHPDQPRYANVEFYAGVVMDACGVPRSMFTPTFAVSRVVGWCANIAEQARSRKIIRPRARYVGPAPR